MKAVFALAFAGAVAAIPAGWQDAPETPVKITSTEPAEETKTWADEPSIETTTSEEPKTWEDVSSTPVADTTTSTWADYSITTPVAEETTSTWGDYSVPVTETTSTLTAITTYCPKPTTFTDKGDVYTVTEATTLTLTKGPYTVTIPIYEETSTVCDTPVAPTGAASTWVDVEAPVAPTGAPVAPTGAAGAPEKPSGEEPVSPYTGSASKMAGAGLAGVAAFAALLL